MKHIIEEILEQWPSESLHVNNLFRIINFFQADEVVIIEAISAKSETITCTIAAAIRNLWQDPAVQTAYEKRHDFHLHESAKQFRLIFLQFLCEFKFDNYEHFELEI